MKTNRERFNYGIGALPVLAISVGLAAIIYGFGLMSFDLYVLPAWIFGPLGVYTAVYSMVAGIESTYYLVWGVIMVTVAFISAFYVVTYIVPILGILLIVLAVIGIVAYVRGKQ